MASRFSNKTQQVLDQVWKGLQRGALMGAAVGGIIGGGMLVIGAAPLTLAGVVTYGLGYTLAGSLFGMNTGGFLGGIKGIFSRTHPDGKQLMEDALECANHPDHPRAEVPQPQQAPLPDMPAPQQPAPQQASPQAGGISPEAMADLKAMTETLNQIQANAQQAGQGAAQPPAENWQQRVQPAPQQEIAAKQR